MESQGKVSRLTKFNKQWGVQLSGYSKRRKTLEKVCCSIPYFALIVPALKGYSNLVTGLRQHPHHIPRIVLAATLVGIPISLILDLIATFITQPIERRRLKRLAKASMKIIIRGPEFIPPTESSEEESDGEAGEAETTSPVPLQSSDESLEESESSMKIQRRKRRAGSNDRKQRKPRKHIEEEEIRTLEKKVSQFSPMPNPSIETTEESVDYEDSSSDY